MPLKRFCVLLPAAVLGNTALAEPAVMTPQPANIILMMADDLGYGDLGITGSKQIPTPHIDALAANGVHFTNAYVSSPVCAPSRAGLMTSKHQVSFGFRDNLAPVQPGHDPEFIGLPTAQTTLADRLKALGYTTGIVGKWHLGELPEFSPLKRGFDEFWGYLGGAHDYFKAEPGGNHITSPILSNYKGQGPLIYLTDDQGDECVDFIRRHKERRFFLFASIRLPMLYNLSAENTEQNDLVAMHPDRMRAMLKELGRWEVHSPNLVFGEPAGWRVRHLKFYDSAYQMRQPE